MSLNRRNPARDLNEAEIVDALFTAGCFVSRISGPGVPDLLVGHQGRWILMEVKHKTGTLTPKQIEWWDAATGLDLPIEVVRSAEEALALLV